MISYLILAIINIVLYISLAKNVLTRKYGWKDWEPLQFKVYHIIAIMIISFIPIIQLVSLIFASVIVIMIMADDGEELKFKEGSLYHKITTFLNKPL